MNFVISILFKIFIGGMFLFTGIFFDKIPSFWKIVIYIVAFILMDLYVRFIISIGGSL